MGINCGVDIIEIDRIKKALEKERFIERVYTNYEAVYCNSKAAGKYESFAVRFAAKEAVLKALGTGIWRDGISFTDIEVSNDSSGKPEIRLYGQAEAKFQQLGATSISISLSHSRNYAVAMVVVETDHGGSGDI